MSLIENQDGPPSAEDDPPSAPPQQLAERSRTQARRSTRSNSTRSPLLWLVFTGVAVLVLGLGAFVGLRSLRPHIYTGTVLQGSTPAPPLDGLRLIDGESADFEAQAGKVTLVFFGYTHCPDICPTTLANVSTAIDQLGDDHEKVNMWMVSVDTERDNAQYLEEYVDHFSPAFAGLSGDRQAVDTAASLYGIHYQLHDPDADGDYLVDHSAGIMGIGPDGVLRVLWAPDTAPTAMAADIQALLG